MLSRSHGRLLTRTLCPTLFSYMLVYVDTRPAASLPPQTEVTSQLYRGTCEQIALGRNVPYQNPYMCPYNAVSGTVGCSPQQVEVWPSPLEAKMQGNLDAAGRVITNFVWPVHIPATESANVELSLVTFDPSFPPGKPQAERPIKVETCPPSPPL